MTPTHSDKGQQEAKQRQEDGVALLGSDHIRRDVVLVDRVIVGERFSVQEAQQAPEGIGLALVRRRREQQQIGRRLG